MKVKITTNSLTIDREIPTSWEEVTFKQFLAIADCKNEKEIFAALTGVDAETLAKAKIKGLDKIIALLSFLSHKPQITYLPTKVLGYSIPQNLEFEEVQIYEDLKSEMREVDKITKDETSKENEVLLRYTLYCAMFTCSQVYGEYDYEKATLIAPQFMNAPAVEVLAVGNFTLVKFIGLKRGINPLLPERLTLWKKSKLVLISKLKSMAFTVRYYILKRKLRLQENN